MKHGMQSGAVFNVIVMHKGKLRVSNVSSDFSAPYKARPLLLTLDAITVCRMWRSSDRLKAYANWR